MSQNKSVAIKAKELISEAESSAPSSNAHRGLRRGCCAQTSDPISRRFPQSINQPPVFFPVFLARFWKFFTCRQFQPYRSVLLLVFSSSLGGFSLIESSGFLPRFLIEFRRFFHQLNTPGFLLSFPLGLGGFLYQALTSNAYTLVRTCV